MNPPPNIPCSKRGKLARRGVFATLVKGVAAALLSCAWLIMLNLGGCGQPKGVIFEAVESGPVWPEPPDVARIRYVGDLRTSADLKPSKDFLESLGESLFGGEEVRSMLTPFAITTDGRDRVFVCDSNAQVVHVFDLVTRVYQQWKPPNHGAGFSQPVGVAYDSLERLLVTDAVEHTIHVFSHDGEYLGEMAGSILTRPSGIAVDGVNRRIYVADTGAHCIQVLAIDGELLATLGQRGIEHGQFNYPTNVAVDREARLYVSDTLNSRVQVFDPQLTFLRQIGTRGDLPGYFSQPKGIAIDGENHVYVVDSHFESVQIFDAEGRLLLTFGGEGRGPGQFWLPAGLHIDSNNRIWIADSYNRRVQVFDYLPEVSP